MQADPIGYAAGMNMYGYVRGDPVNYTDPFGLAETGGNCGRGEGDRHCGQTDTIGHRDGSQSCRGCMFGDAAQQFVSDYQSGFGQGAHGGRGCSGQMCRTPLYPDSGFDGHRQGMLTVGLVGFGVTAATCGASYRVGCVLGYLASTRMATEGATGTDVLAVAVTETLIAAGANPVDAVTISDTTTLMFDIGTFAVGGVNLVKQPLFMFNKPGVIGPSPPLVPTASAAASTAIGPIDIIHDAMVVEGLTK